MWLHKSRSVSKRKKRCNISFLNFGEKIGLRHNTDIYLPNEETKINIKELFENKGIDCDNAFNFKLSGLQANIFTLPIKDSQDNTSIYIGLQEIQIDKNILCITKDNNIRYYLLLPYFKVDKPNLEEGKYLKGDTKMSYHLGLFEMQVQDKILKSAILIDTISLKNESSFNEFFDNLLFFTFDQIGYIYRGMGLYGKTYCLKNTSTSNVYFFDFSDILNPKIGNIKFKKRDFTNVWECILVFKREQWFFQLTEYQDEKYIVKDNCNGKYEKMRILKKNEYCSNLLIYNKQANTYFPHKKTTQLKLDKDINIRFNAIKDFKHLSFFKLTNRYIRFQFTPFNNLNLAYYYNDQDGHYLCEYCLLAKNKDTYIATELNPKNIINKYRINYGYEHIYHRYLYYLDDYKRVPYVQLWEDKNTNQVYGCILNMRGKWGVFDNEIIVETEE